MQSLSDAEIWQLVEEKSGWASLTTLDEDGFPHTVAIGCVALEGRLYCGCRAGTRKCRNLARNPQACLMLEGGRQRILGVMFQGTARVLDQTEELLEFKRRLARHQGLPEPQEVALGIAYIELTPQRVRSWKR